MTHGYPQPSWGKQRPHTTRSHGTLRCCCTESHTQKSHTCTPALPVPTHLSHLGDTQQPASCAPCPDMLHIQEPYARIRAQTSAHQPASGARRVMTCWTQDQQHSAWSVSFQAPHQPKTSHSSCPAAPTVCAGQTRTTLGAAPRARRLLALHHTRLPRLLHPPEQMQHSDQ